MNEVSKVEQVANFLRKKRIDRGLTQETLAFDCELSKGIISNFEAQKTSISFKNFLKIIGVLGVKLSDLDVILFS